MQQLQSPVEEADLRIPMHVLDCLRAGLKTCVVISNDTDVIVTLFFRNCGLEQEEATLPVLSLFTFCMHDWVPLCAQCFQLYMALQDVISQVIGTKKAALKADAVVYWQGFGATDPLVPSLIQQAE